MKSFIENLTGGYSSTAKIVDGTLILSLPDAESPIVWRMDLGQVRSSAIEVRDGSDGSYILTLKTPKNDVHTIAPFRSRAAAVKALMAVSRAMEHAHGQLRPYASDAADAATVIPVYKRPAMPMTRGKWIVAGLAVIAIYILYSMISTPGVRTESFPATTAPVASAPPPAPENNIGVPQSADNFLRAR